MSQKQVKQSQVAVQVGNFEKQTNQKQ